MFIQFFRCITWVCLKSQISTTLETCYIGFSIKRQNTFYVYKTVTAPKRFSKKKKHSNNLNLMKP